MGVFKKRPFFFEKSFSSQIFGVSMSFVRRDGRLPETLRNIKVTFNAFGYAAGSVLFEIGNTKVMCCASLQPGVPKFLKGKKTGWLTAEYSMLPMSSQERIEREATTMRRNGRSVEISRLIGRSLRTIIDFDKIGEKTIYIDCDVLQADGGTRTACITGSCLALRAAVVYWLENKIISQNILKGGLASVSVGVFEGLPLLDLSYDEDSRADADFNFVITDSDKIVELQGAAEGSSISWDQFEGVKNLACSGTKKLFELCDEFFEREFGFCPSSEHFKPAQDLLSCKKNKNIENTLQVSHNSSEIGRKSGSGGMFSLGNRINLESQ